MTGTPLLSRECARQLLVKALFHKLYLGTVSPSPTHSGKPWHCVNSQLLLDNNTRRLAPGFPGPSCAYWPGISVPQWGLGHGGVSVHLARVVTALS